MMARPTLPPMTGPAIQALLLFGMEVALIPLEEEDGDEGALVVIWRVWVGILVVLPTRGVVPM